MSRYGSSEEHQPVAWVRGHPLYAAHLIAAIFVVSMLLTTAAIALNFGGWMEPLPFVSGLVLHGELWRLLTYGLVNPPSLGFVIDVAMIAWFGREIEKVIGRRRFLGFYAALYLLTPLLLTLVGIWYPESRAGETGAFALFIAFAAFYPNLPLIFGVLAKWAAWILVGIYTLMALAAHAWTDLLSLWATTGLAYGFVRYEQGRWSWPRIRWPMRRSGLRALPDPKPLSRRFAATAEMDALLDKIAQSGLSSLTSKERAQLQQRRQDMLGR